MHDISSLLQAIMQVEKEVDTVVDMYFALKLRNVLLLFVLMYY